MSRSVGVACMVTWAQGLRPCCPGAAPLALRVCVPYPACSCLCGCSRAHGAGFNTLLRYLSPLTVALAFQMEPLVGSVIGWAAGVMSPPGALTYGGGALVVVATIFVTIASADRERQEEAGKATAAKQELVPAASWESEDCGAAGGLGGPGRGTAGQEDEEAQRLLVARGSPS